MTNFSSPSSPVFSIDVPEVSDIKSTFTYNFYVQDEGTVESSGIPDGLKSKSPEQISSEGTSFALRVPRFVTVRWRPVYSSKIFSKDRNLISNNISKIVTEDGFTSSKFFNYTYSNVDSIEDAFNDINKDGKLDLGDSQAKNIDRYVEKLLNEYAETPDAPNGEATRRQIMQSIQNIEKIADRPSVTLGLSFYDNDGQRISDTSGFDQLVSDQSVFLKTQINSLVATDLFDKCILPEETISQINKHHKTAKNRQFLNLSEAQIQPISIGRILPAKDSNSVFRDAVGYIIERYEKTDQGFVKNKTFVVENPDISQITDLFVKYGTIYYYAIRTIVKITTPGFDDNTSQIREISFLVSSKPTITSVECLEFVPPPPPVDLDFVWDYKKQLLRVVWGMPVNSQRDIKQFQVFRRSSVEEPFELIKQKSFDFSTKKYLSGEVVDGNNPDMSGENSTFVDYSDVPVMFHIDKEFKVNTEFLTTSKYIYSICCVDAHGMVSNYGAQFEVSFDFYQNKLIKKFISAAGAPRPYPNLRIDIDLFKDTIKVKGSSSTKMKVYFVPEYFKVVDNNNNVTRLISTKSESSFYKIQFLNLQNQKNDSLKIEINDPLLLTK